MTTISASFMATISAKFMTLSWTLPLLISPVNNNNNNNNNNNSYYYSQGPYFLLVP
jgi:hypothetical protein